MNRPSDNQPKQPEQNSDGGTTRREFLKTAGLGAAGVLAMSAGGVQALAQTAGSGAAALPTGKSNPAQLKGAPIKPRVRTIPGRVLGANDRINIAHVGVGGQGGSILHILMDNRAANNTMSIGVCEVYAPRREGAKGAIVGYESAAQVQVENDYRRLLENKDVDAVVVATPEHWHAQISVDAMEAGKHVYCEKPMTRYLEEAFAMMDAQERTKRVFQVGSQGCSDTKWYVAGRAVREGRVGAVVSAQGSYTRNSRDGEWNYHIEPNAGPDNLDWKMWLGSAPDRPWNDEARSRFFRYRKYRDYSAGLIGDLLPHKLHPLMIATFLDKPEFPSKVTAIGTRKVSTDREVSDTVHVIAEFASGPTMYVLLSTVNEQGLEDMIRGHQATMRFGGNRVQVRPERPFAEDIDPADLPVEGPGESVQVHLANWIDCIRTGKKPNADIGLATRVMTICAMAEQAEVMGKTVHFDAAKRRVIS